MAAAVEHGRAEGQAFSVALVDVDNFRMLNETYGHSAGNDVLMTVLEGLAREAPPRPSSADTGRTS